MAFIDPLNPLTPADSDLVKDGDDRIRELKRALVERFLSLVNDVDADPWTLKNNAVVEAMIADDSVSLNKLKSNSVNNAKVLDGTLMSVKVNGVGSTDKLVKAIYGKVAVVGASIGAGLDNEYTVAVPGAEQNDIVVVSRNLENSYSRQSPFFAIVGWIPSSGNVTIALANPTAGALIAIAGDMPFYVLKRVG